jgi:hypothetical protein
MVKEGFNTTPKLEKVQKKRIASNLNCWGVPIIPMAMSTIPPHKNII